MQDPIEFRKQRREVIDRPLKFMPCDTLYSWRCFGSGYACCAFLRCEEEEEVKVSLVLAKFRVAPVKRPTIPRLQLLGAAIGAPMLELS
ncbi:hypothetical protein AVEN_157774-1 [Araneus ventricosus]|uniref:Uncharacterized protein n=1 Tax=Araneus ventricosus TaxID=182803 RepID=A0A4Y2F4R3_ARAVE|nr:hypothetical protein AVEN_157774-1 [Araneus ventricosus]